MRQGKKIAIATLNSERSLNSLSLEMIDLLQEKFTAWENDDSISCVFLQGVGEKAFCAGGDVVAFDTQVLRPMVKNCRIKALSTFFTREYKLDYHIHTYSKPVVVWGHGIVMGGGLGLMSGASHRVVTEATRMAMPEVTIGLYPDVGGSWFLNRAPGRTGLYLGLTGASFNGADAKFVGLADRFVPNEQKEAVLAALADEDLSQGTSAAISKVLHRFEKQNIDQQPAGKVQSHYDQIQELTDADSIPELFDSITGYSGDDKWLSKAAAGLAGGCPMTPYLVQQQLNRTRQLSLADVFRLELTMSTNCAKQGHFKEGVRALLIDKDRNPQWTPATVTDVTEADVEKFFEAPWDQHPLADLG